jgi:hypothetical protein
MEFPYYIQKALDLGLLKEEGGKIVEVNVGAVESVTKTARLVEKLQPSTILEREDTKNQEAIVLTRVLSKPSGLAKELWSQVRTAFGVGHGQELPSTLWSSTEFKAIAREIDLTFLGERTGKLISKDSLVTGYEAIISNNSFCSFMDFCETISELSDQETIDRYGDEEIEWDTALDVLKQKRVSSLYRDTLYESNQYLKTDPNIQKALKFLHERSMECISMLSGSIGNQGQIVDLMESITGSPGSNRLNWADYILNAAEQDKPVSTGVFAFDLDIEGGVAPPRPNMPKAGRLMTIAARTGVGKTALGVHIACQLAAGSLTVGFISAELDNRSIEARIIANLTKTFHPIHYSRLDSDDLGFVTVRELELPGSTKSQSKIAEIVSNVSMSLESRGGNILVEAPWGACVESAINTMRSMKAKNPELRAIVLDHFHALARHKGGSASNQSSMLEDRAYRLMTAAKELDIDLFVLAQMNRIGLDSTSNAEPQLNEIRGTDALAHVSHACWLVRKERTEADSPKRDLEIWHSKVRGGQALWSEDKGTLDSVKGFIDKSVIRIAYECSFVESDNTRSEVHRKATSII